MRPISKITPYNDYSILIELNNGHKIILDFSKKIYTIRFAELGNLDVFRKAKTDGYSIIWKNGKTIVSYGEIMEMLKDTNLLFRVI